MGSRVTLPGAALRGTDEPESIALLTSGSLPREPVTDSKENGIRLETSRPFRQPLGSRKQWPRKAYAWAMLHSEPTNKKIASRTRSHVDKTKNEELLQHLRA